MNSRKNLQYMIGASALAMILVLGYLIWWNYHEIIRGAEVSTKNYAEMLAARLDGTMRRADSTLLVLADTLATESLNSDPAAFRSESDNQLRSAMLNFPELSGIGVFDAQGIWIAAGSTNVVKPGISIADRSYFRSLRDSPRAGLEISEVVIARTTGRESITIARALRDKEGRFLGAVVALLDFDNLRKLFQAVNVGPQGNVAIYRRDDFAMVLRQPELKELRGRKLPADNKVRKALESGLGTATLNMVSSVDGIERIYSVNALADYPFFATAGVARDEVLKTWRVSSSVVGAFGVFLMALLIGLLYRLRLADAARVRLAAIVENSNDAVYSMGLNGVVLSWNAGAERMLGYTAAEMIGRIADVTIPSGRLSNRAQNIERILRGEHVYRETTRAAKNGRVIDVFSSHSPVKDDAGKIISVSVILQDITTLKQAQIAAQEHEARFRATFEQVAIGIALIDFQQKIIDVNRCYAEIVGKAPEALIGESAELLYQGDDADIDREIHGQLLSEKIHQYVRDSRFERPDGTALWITRTDSLARDSAGVPLYFISAIEDISARKSAEEGLRVSFDRMNGLLDSAMDAIVGVDSRQRIVIFNTAAEKMFGHRTQDVMGTPVDCLMPDRIRHLHRQHIDNFAGAPVANRIMGELGQMKGLRSNGEEFPIEASISKTGRHGDELFTIILRDLTSRLQADETRISLEAQLRESQKMEAIGTLAGGIAHDFNNILAAILGSVDLARQDSAGNPEVLLSLQDIYNAGKRARELVQQILAFSRRQPTNRQRVNLAPIIMEAAQMLRATVPARLSLKVQCESDLPQVLADATQMIQVTLNLATNAMQAMSTGTGAISVRLDSVMLDARLVASHSALRSLYETRPGRCVRLVVSDTGPGMDKDTLTQIFEPFFTTKPVNEGTGLGLSVVFGIVQTHDGVIVAESQPGDGATFTVYLPAVEGPATAPLSPNSGG